MGKYKIEIGKMNPGSRFYFLNDPDKIVWTVLDSHRKASSGNAVFIYCEDASGKIEDYNSNREVIYLSERRLPPLDEPEDEKDEEIQIKIINKPPAVHKTLRSTLNTNFLSELSKLNQDMQHKESSVKVYSTSDYSVFRMINGNRSINQRKINKIVKKIQDGNNKLPYYPIVVNEVKGHLDINDGQHRFLISKSLKLPVYYIIDTEETSLPDIASINSNVEKWNTKNFINCFVQHDNENYKVVEKFINTYGISLTVALQMLHFGNPGKESGSHTLLNEKFRNGTFEVKTYDEAKMLAEECRLFSTFPNCSSRSFVIAIYRIKKAALISLSDLLEAYKKRPEMLTQQANFKAYINTLEQIVNVGKQKRIVII